MLLLGSLLASYDPAPAGASSHREAPLIAFDPQADNTDVYAFISPDANDTVTIVANYIPLEAPYGGPNYFQFADDVLYSINIDNVGDARPRISYQFRFTTTTRNPETFLYNVGPVTSLDDPDLNVVQTYAVTEVISPTSGTVTTTTLGTDLPTPPVNIGEKSTPEDEYIQMAADAVQTLDGGIRVFAGQRDDPFFVDLGSIFDLLTLRGQAPPIGYESTGPVAGVDNLKGYNTHSIVIQVPIDRLLQGAPDGETVIGVWATASRPSMRVLSPLGGVATSGEFVQVSRLGMPLTNEVVIPRALKDAFNGLKPEQDFGLFTSGTDAGNLLQESVLNPELQRLLNALYGVPNPGENRQDILSIFLTGMTTTKPFSITAGVTQVSVPAGTVVNQPQNVQPADMLRLNTAEPFRPGTTGSICAAEPNYQLGVLAGDVCGFPNGRRLQDDVTDIELLAVAGAAYNVLTDETFDFNPALIGVLTDSVSENDQPFLDEFPYLATPNAGQDYSQDIIQPFADYLPLVRRTMMQLRAE
ncbi:MAG: DUF4331 domain-containing protein [Chloroflexaceae bacterium]|nr:DUF4331 domain-containing protein [Chloroflexaceae bacterium]